MLINIVDCNTLNLNYYGIKVYDIDNNFVCTEHGYKNQFILNVKHGTYRLKIYKNNSLVDLVTILYNEKYNKVCYKFGCMKYRTYRKIKLILYDYHYSGLKIERGNILLTNIM